MEHNPTVDWLEGLKRERDYHQQGTLEISEVMLKKKCNKIPNWKAPGWDAVQGFWIKSMSNAPKLIKLLGFVRRASKSMQSMRTRRTLFLSIVRGQLGYASQVWSPQLAIGLRKLSFRCDVPYKTRLRMTKLILLSFWYEYLDDLPVARQRVRITRYSCNSSVTYIPKKCRTLSYQPSFFVRRARIWNVLPESLKEHNQTPLAFIRDLY